jgi:RNA polymerase sigma factor (sigma-70 family)
MPADDRAAESARPDAELVQQFVRERAEGAFAQLVRRHGPMVLGVCRRLLRCEADAEDAFQATFLVLACKAATIRPPGMVGNWLHGVASRTALAARRAAALRREKERACMSVTPGPAPASDETLALLHEELARLPDRYRRALVLCDLEGKSHQDAAKELCCAPGTIASRLARGRTLLGRRLARRGVALSAAALASLLVAGTGAAQVPEALVTTTVKIALLVAAGQPVALSAPVSLLMKGAIVGVMTTSKKITVGACLAALLLLMVGGVTLYKGGEWVRSWSALNNPARTQALKQMGLAFHGFGDSLPAQYRVDDNQKPLLSWRVQILPHIGEEQLYRQFHLDEPWDSDHNKKLIAQMPALYRSPGSRADAGKTTYLLPVGPTLLFDGAKKPKLREITDGTSRTIMLLEVDDDHAVEWTKPEDLRIDPRQPKNGVVVQGGINALFCDGSTRVLRAEIPDATFWSYLTPNGGERIADD